MTGQAPGVYAIAADGTPERVHEAGEGAYGLEEIVEIFQLGQREDPGPGEAVAITLGAEELSQLKALADHHSFDFEPGFVEMCQELAQWARGRGLSRYRFTADF